MLLLDGSTHQDAGADQLGAKANESPAGTRPSRWFAFRDDETFVEILGATDFHSADDECPGNTVWIFREEELRQFLQRGNAVLAPPPPPPSCVKSMPCDA